MKKCTKCNKELPDSAFYRERKACRACMSKICSQYNKKRREQARLAREKGNPIEEQVGEVPEAIRRCMCAIHEVRIKNELMKMKKAGFKPDSEYSQVSHILKGKSK